MRNSRSDAPEFAQILKPENAHFLVCFPRGKQLQNYPYRLLIAEDHHLAGVLDRMKAPPVQFPHEAVAADVALYMFDLAPEHAPVARGL